MKDKLLEEFMVIISDIKSFASAEIPDIFNQIIQYSLIKEIVLIIVFTLLGIVSKIIMSHLNKECEKYPYDCDGIFFGVFVTFVASIGFGISAIYELLIFLQIWFAPKIFLINKFLGMDL